MFLWNLSFSYYSSYSTAGHFISTVWLPHTVFQILNQKVLNSKYFRASTPCLLHEYFYHHRAFHQLPIDKQWTTIHDHVTRLVNENPLLLLLQILQSHTDIAEDFQWGTYIFSCSGAEVQDIHDAICIVKKFCNFLPGKRMLG